MSHKASVGWIEDGIHHYPTRVFFDDTDAAGIVYHANHIKMMERARTSMSILLDLDHSKRFKKGLPYFVVRAIQINYLKPAHLGEELTVTTQYQEFKGPRAIIHQDIWCGDDKISSSTVTLVAVNSHGKPVKVPVEFAATLSATHKG